MYQKSNDRLWNAKTNLVSFFFKKKTQVCIGFHPIDFGWFNFWKEKIIYTSIDFSSQYFISCIFCTILFTKTPLNCFQYFFFSFAVLAIKHIHISAICFCVKRKSMHKVYSIHRFLCWLCWFLPPSLRFCQGVFVCVCVFLLVFVFLFICFFFSISLSLSLVYSAFGFLYTPIMC